MQATKIQVLSLPKAIRQNWTFRAMALRWEVSSGLYKSSVVQIKSVITYKFSENFPGWCKVNTC